MKYLFSFVFSFLIMAVAGTVAQAATSEWQDLGGGKVRLVASVDPSTNKVGGVIEVRLEEGWKTYWRYPGSSGIPPKFDFSKSKGYLAGNVEFPAPLLIGRGNGAYAGYTSNVLFPFQGDMLSQANGKIQLDLFIGLCAIVCIPARASINLDTKELLVSDPAAGNLVETANTLIPALSTAEATKLDVSVNSDQTLQISVYNPDKGVEPTLFVEGPIDWYLTPANFISRTGDTVYFSLDISDIPENVDPLATKLRFTLVNGSQGIEIQQ